MLVDSLAVDTRKDGRNNQDLQEIYLEKGVKRDCISSIYLETNHLKMICSIKGIINQTQIGKSKADDAGNMDVVVNILIPSYYNDGKIPFNKISLELQLEELFSKNIFIEKYPRTKLAINLEIFEFSCNILPFAAMAMTLALNDANIEQKGLITCANLILTGSTVIVDPTYEEEKTADAKIIFGCNVDLQENNLLIQNGYLEETDYKKLIGTAIKICEAYNKLLISKL